MIDKNKIFKIEKDYMNGATYKKIIKKYTVTHSELVYLIQKNKWKRESNRSKVQKGNKNAKGNPGGPGAGEGNKNSLKTGEYENIFASFFTEEEKQIYEDNEENKKKLLLEEIAIARIRERRMLDRIRQLSSGKEMTINSMSKINYKNSGYNGDESATTTTHAENTIVAIQRIEEALTRVQENKRRSIEALHRMDIDDNRLEIEIMKMEIEAAKESGEYENKDNGESLIEALNLKAKEVWNDADKKQE